MKIYLLTAKESVGYDSYYSHVVIARSPHHARRLCPCGDEGRIWTDAKLAECREIGEALNTASRSEGRVVLSSFSAG